MVLVMRMAMMSKTPTIKLLGRPEIGEFEIAVRVDEDVLAFDIPVVVGDGKRTEMVFVTV